MPQYFRGKDKGDGTVPAEQPPRILGNTLLHGDGKRSVYVLGEPASMQLMLREKALEGSSFLACGFGGMSDVAVVHSKQIDKVGPLKFLHGSHFRLAQCTGRLLGG
ncbi:MAG: hypothetical protein OEY21_02870, partial [Nitrospira sp.]|nr:hypothetical protein [Nitrospira sp.]